MTGEAAPPLARVAPVVTSLCGLFIISQFYRSAIAVMAPDLVRDMSLSPEALGILTGAFFLASAAMQIPVGILLDRFGPRRVIPSILCVAVAGALLFASAEAAAELILGQFMIGLGCSGVLVGGLLIFSRWFSPDRFTTVAGVAIAVSLTGTFLSGTPLAAAIETVGWRGAMYAATGVTALFGLLVALLARDAPPGHPYLQRTPESLNQTLRGLAEVLRNRDVYPILALAFVAYGVTISVRGLWGGPYLADVHGLGALPRGHVLLLMSVGIVCGVLAYGPLDRRARSRRRLVLAGSAVTVACCVVLAALTAPPLWLIVVLFALLGGSGGYFLVLLAHGRDFFPDHLLGRTMTTINFANFAGAAAIQMATGVVVGLFPTAAGAAPEAAYRAVFGFLALALVVALAVYARAREPSGAEISARAATGR